MLFTRLLFIFFSFCVFNNGGTNALQQQAKEKHKNIAVYFSGSDWCTVCHKFKNQVLNNQQVDSLLKIDYIYYVADFPQRTKQPDSLKAVNDFLAEQLNNDGTFPKLVIADDNYAVKAVIKSGENICSVIEKLKKNRK